MPGELKGQDARFHVTAIRNVIQVSQCVLRARSSAEVKKGFLWHEDSNVYRASKLFLSTGDPHHAVSERADLEEWNRLWGLENTGSTEGLIRFQGGDLDAKTQTHPEQLTPEDFRLRPDSAGYQAGPDGKDLGADIDLVGPGEAYERWRQTPEYEEWQKETRELMKAAVADQPNAEADSETDTAEEPKATNMTNRRLKMSGVRETAKLCRGLTTAAPLGPQVSRRSTETFGQARGRVGRPVHNTTETAEEPKAMNN